MPRYEEVKTTFWTEADMEDWAPHAKLLYIYLLTTPLSHGITGAFPVTERQIRSHTNLKPRQIATSFATVGGRVRRYEGAWVWVVATFKHRCHSPNHYKAALTYLRDEVPAGLVVDFARKYVGSDVDVRYGSQLSTLQGATKGLPPTPTPNPTPNPSPIPAPEPSHSEVFHTILQSLRTRGGTGTRYMKLSNDGTYEAVLSDNRTGICMRRVDRPGPDVLVFSPKQMAEFEVDE